MNAATKVRRAIPKFSDLLADRTITEVEGILYVDLQAAKRGNDTDYLRDIQNEYKAFQEFKLVLADHNKRIKAQQEKLKSIKQNAMPFIDELLENYVQIANTAIASDTSLDQLEQGTENLDGTSIFWGILESVYNTLKTPVDSKDHKESK